MASSIGCGFGMVATATLFSTIGLAAAYGEQAADAALPPKTQWALLIGVREYDNASPLRFSGEDVRKLDATLRDHLGYDRSKIMTMRDDNPEALDQPYRSSIVERIPQFLAKAGEDDSVAIYFSGHAFRDIGSGQVYLAPRDFNSSDVNTMDKTGIAIDWLRKQLAHCKARQQLLILDACHSGGAGGGSRPGDATSADLRSGFGSLDKLIILASCGSEENSQEWESKHQGLFSYWLSQGLHGRAAGHDDTIDFDELKNYVTSHVVRTSESLRDRQNPVAVKSESATFTFHLATRSIDTLISDIADELAENMEDQKLKHVGVPFFNFNNKDVDTPLGMLLASKLEKALMERAFIKNNEEGQASQQEPAFRVVDPRNLLKMLNENNITRDDFYDLVVLRDFSSGTGEAAAVVAGNIIQHPNDRKILIECQLEKAQGKQLTYVAKAVGYAELDAGTTLKPIDPFGDPNCPVHVQFMVRAPHETNFVERPTRKVNGRTYLPVRDGEVYQLWIDNRAGKIVLLRAMVDGCNTLPQRDIAPADVQIAKPWEVKVPLPEARPWILGPEPATVAIRGFAEQLNDSARKSNLREFQVADVRASSGDRKDYTDTPGRVDLAFYYDLQTRGKTLVPGEPIEDLIPLVPGPQVGAPIGIATVELVDARAAELALAGGK